MKHLTTLALFAMFSGAIFSQGTLPLNYNAAVDGSTYPTGMTTDGTFNQGLALGVSKQATFFFEATPYDKLAEFRFRWGGETAQYCAIIQESENGSLWETIDSVGTLGICTKSYNAFASGRLCYVAVPVKKESKYVKVTHLTSGTNFYLFAASIRKDYRELSFDADFSGIASISNSNPIARTGGTMSVTSGFSSYNHTTKPDSVSMHGYNYYRFGTDAAVDMSTNSIVVELTDPVPADGGQAEFWITTAGSNAATLSVYNLTSGSAVLVYRNDSLATDKTHGTKVKVDLPAGLTKFAVSRGYGADGGLTTKRTWYLFGIKTYITAATSVSTKLSDLMVGGVTIDNFNKNITDYVIYTRNDTEEEAPEVVSYTTEATSGVTVLAVPSGVAVAEYINDTATVTITVTDNSDSENKTVYTVRFIKDKIAPVVTSISPSEGASVNRTGTITLNFSEKILLNAFCPDAVLLNGLTPANTGVLSGDGLSWSLAFTMSDWNGTDALQFTLPAGYFTDGQNNFTAAQVRNLVFDQTAPSFVSFTPMPGSSNATPTGTVKVVFDENIKMDTLVADAVKIIKNGVETNAVFRTDYTYSGKTITANYSGNFGDVYSVLLKDNVLSDMSGNYHRSNSYDTLHFTIDKPLGVFPYELNTNYKTLNDVPGWITMNNGKQFRPDWQQSGDCAGVDTGAYRFEANDTIEMYFEKLGTLQLKVTANGNRIIAISDNYTGETYIRWYDATCNGNFTREINSEGPVKVKVWGFLGNAGDYGRPNASNVTTASGTLYYVSATHPIQNKKPEIKSVETNNTDSVTISWKPIAGWEQNPTGSNGYYVYYDNVKNGSANMKFVQDTVLGIGGLNEKTKYYFTVIAAIEGSEVAGEAGTKLYSLQSDVDSATTYGAPEVIATNPDAGNAAVVIPLGGGQIELTFDQAIDTVTGYSVTMKKVSDVAAENMKVSYLSSAPTVITLSYVNALTPDSIYTINIGDGFVKSVAAGVPNRAVQFSYRAENPVAPPVIVSVKYGQDKDLDGAEDIPFTENLVATVNFTKKVIYQNDGLQVESRINSVYAGSDSTAWCIEIGDLEQETIYNLVISDNAFVDEAGLKLEQESNYTVTFTTVPNYVEDIVFYTDFSTVAEHTPVLAKLADSIVEYKSTLYTTDRITYEITNTDTVKLDDFVISTTNTSTRKIELYGYNSNSAHGQQYGLSWGRLALSNAPLTLSLPEVTGPAKLMWSIAGNTGLRLTSLRDGETELQVDSVNSDGSIPNAKLCHYEYLGSESKVFNLFTKSQPSQIHDYEVIKSVKQNSVSPLYSHWFNPTKETALDTTGYIDVRFNKRIELADVTLITLSGVAAISVDSVKAIGNALRIYYAAAGSWTDTVFEVNVAVGAVRQETTGQELSLAANYTFDVRSLANQGITVSTDPVKIDVDVITIYPNPVRDNLYIRCNSMKSVEVLDLTGKSVALKKGGADEYVINMQGQKSGIYFVRIETANGIVRTCKIVR
ncbi:MAG: Ig-like domain-containing protein [Bacteroidales bacterium]|jgi:hypothetical protein|nr:Ig-like domain-containing protein [Bacteroidales bacterium]